MTPYESERILKALAHLRQSDHLHLCGKVDEAIECERSARSILAALLLTEGVEPDDHMTSEGEPL